jgi:hypothetical protein
MARYELVRIIGCGGLENTFLPNKFVLSSGEDATVGTCASNAMSIPWSKSASSRFVSRRHATVTPTEDGSGHFIVDLASLNGTFVNDEFLLPGHAKFLKDGDVVWFGGKRPWIKGRRAQNECCYVYRQTSSDLLSIRKLPTISRLKLRGFIRRAREGGQRQIGKRCCSVRLILDNSVPLARASVTRAH